MFDTTKATGNEIPGCDTSSLNTQMNLIMSVKSLQPTSSWWFDTYSNVCIFKHTQRNQQGTSIKTEETNVNNA